MLPMFARAGVALIPGASRLPFVGGGAKEIPDLTLVLDDVQIDRDRLTSYDHVCEFTVTDRLPATYPHMLAFPLHLALLTDGKFPFPAIGLVHIYNRITQHRTLRAAEKLSLRVWATPLEPHPRGKQFSIHSEARVGDELVWEEVSTNLKRGSGGGSGATAPEVPSAEALPATATWNLPGDLGRRYGLVSGDFNPIHMHSLSARLFGFPSAIAHGMWSKARCLAALEARLPEQFTVEAAFRKPILLPATVDFAEEPADGRLQFGLRDAAKGTPHLDGTVSFE
jgi:acyl dehydratase